MRKGGGTNEHWKPIPGFTDLYEVSNMGRVRTFSTKKLKTQSGGKGTTSRYRYVTLYKNNKNTKLMTHRLVAKAFVPNPAGYPNVLHIKNDRENNRASNLKWGTQLHNHLDAVRDGTHKSAPLLLGVDQPLSKLNPDKIREIRSIRDSGLHFTQEGLAAQFGVSRGTLRSILKNKHWRHVT